MPQSVALNLSDFEPMKISTEYWAKPIPIRCCDWVAIDSDTYDGAPDAHCPVGYGETEEEAIGDLLCQLHELEFER